MKAFIFLFFVLFCSSVFGSVTVINEYADSNYLGNGLAKFTFHSEPKYLKDENNLWQDINADFKLIEDGFFDWKSTFNYFTLKVKEDGTFQFKHKGDTVSAKLIGIGFFNKQTKDYIIETDINFGTPIVDKNKIEWSLPLQATYTIYSHNGNFRDVLVLPQTVKTYLKNNRPEGWDLNSTWIGLIYQFEKDLVSSIDVNGDTNLSEFESEESIHFMQNGRRVHSIIKAHAWNTDLNHYDWNSYYANVWNKLKKLKNNLYIEAVPIQSLWSADGNLNFNATISFDVNVGSDDATESNTGVTVVTSPEMTLQFGMWGLGLRFQGTEVPQGSTISEATITTCGGQNCDPGVERCESEVYGQDADDTITFNEIANPNFNISSRTKTTASTTWLETTSLTPNSTFTCRDWNVTTIVQELVDRGSFAENTMAFLVDVTFIGRNKQYSVFGYESANPSAVLEVTYEAQEDFSFSLSLPSSNCTEGKGSIDAGVTCDRAYFDYNGTINCGTTEDKIQPEGQDWNSTPFWIIDNQSTTPNDFALNIDTNQALPSGIKFIAAEADLIWSFYPACITMSFSRCLVLNDTNKFVKQVQYSQGTQDYNLFLFTDYALGCSTGQHDLNADFYATGVI